MAGPRRACRQIASVHAAYGDGVHAPKQYAPEQPRLPLILTYPIPTTRLRDRFCDDPIKGGYQHAVFVNLGLGADFDERRLFLAVIGNGRRRLAIWISVTPKWLWCIP
jgi:hypothetical protein